MRILARTGKCRNKYTLLSLMDGVVRKRVHWLVRRGKYTQAILVALKEGNTLGVVYEKEKGRIRADLLLTPESAHWDLTV
jgi:hypothetical protein